ncbi:hypothetical protein [Eudoraea chungangensis]|uniref:hypothetical protein n=1 Tax=Eudoraea chungangensis TaxID=1481905 RepID=UPI0023ED974E|nr:hypothetical protein [Eudoraea chungangensis]
MMKIRVLIAVNLVLLQASILSAQETGFEEIGSRLFEKDNISTDEVEFSSSMSTSQKEIFFARSSDKWGQGKMKSFIYTSVKHKGKWSEPKLAEFSGVYDDSDPHITKDGNSIYFISSRPSKDVGTSADIWVVERQDNGSWGESYRLKEPINSMAAEYSPRTDNYGNLYFASNRLGGFGQGDLYIAKQLNGQFVQPINLGNTINSKFGEWNLEVNGKGDLIIFEASQKIENLSPYGDLYISFNNGRTWSEPLNISELNTTGSDLYPNLVNNDSLLYYTSSLTPESIDTDIYRIDFTELMNKYRRLAIYKND